MKIYVASSWRNEKQPEVVKALRELGHDVYDFRNPAPGNNGFGWRQIDPDWQGWSPERFRELLNHPVAIKGFDLDMNALKAADVVVLVMPCGRSAHLELGYAIGTGKSSVILLDNGEPELMYKMATYLVTSIPEMIAALQLCAVNDAINHELHRWLADSNDSLGG